MKRAINVHRADFIAIAALIVLAIVVIGYILEHQPAFTFGQSYYSVRAEFATSAAVTPGQGQAVTIAGVQVGQVGGVELQNGRAVVTTCSGSQGCDGTTGKCADACTAARPSHA